MEEMKSVAQQHAPGVNLNMQSRIREQPGKRNARRRAWSNFILTREKKTTLAGGSTT